MQKKWEIFDRIGSLVKSDDKNIDSKVDTWLSAVMERIADALHSMGSEGLHEGASAARSTFEHLDSRYSMDPISPAFIGGRLAAAADLLGYAAARTADAETASIAQRAPYARILSELAKRALRNVDLGTKVNKTEAQICRDLKKLRDLDLIAPQRRGREVFNVLTPIGRLAVEEGVQHEQRVPLEQTNVIDFSASRRPQLSELQPVAPVPGSELPRLRNIR